MKLINNGSILETKDLSLCFDVMEKESFIFYRTIYGKLLCCIDLGNVTHEFTRTYDVKLNLRERLFGWNNKPLNIRKPKQRGKTNG